jgi:L-seryl-tRNA(Ser) seleniumtransferase
MSDSSLRELPSVEEAASHPEVQELIRLYSGPFIKGRIREELGHLRQALRTGQSAAATRDELTRQLLSRLRLNLERFFASRLNPVLNATGVILHTGLGRAPFAAAARENVNRIMEGYCSLELDMESGKRGERNDAVEKLICALCGAEAAIVANNNAAAVLLALNTLCLGREAIISRGQLIEIGGSFRLPDVMDKSGAIMHEIGTTNKTRLQDYEKAVNEHTGAIVIAHTSNYRVVGFTEEPELAQVVALAHSRSVPVIHDLGGGVLVDLRRFGLPYEPLVQDSLAAGVDVVTFSGDKVLGGPQSGLLVGKQEYIRRIHANPLMRALRCDKLIFAALEATLRLYFEEASLLQRHPALAMLSEAAETVRLRAEKVQLSLKPELLDHFSIAVRQSQAQAGSGALPLEKIPSYALVISPQDGKTELWAARLRTGTPPVLGYIQEDEIWLDLRTVRDEEELALASALNNILTGKPAAGSTNQ